MWKYDILLCLLNLIDLEDFKQLSITLATTTWFCFSDLPVG